MESNVYPITPKKKKKKKTNERLTSAHYMNRHTLKYSPLIDLCFHYNEHNHRYRYRLFQSED